MHKRPLDRRSFLQTTVATTLVASATRLMPTRPDDPPFKISLAQWSLHRELKSGKMDNLDFAPMARKEWDLDAVEYVNSFFKAKAEDEAYLGDMKKRAGDHKVTSLLIMVDGEGALGDANPKKRKKAVDNHRKWVSAAKFLGCHSIRVNAGSSGTWEEQRDRAAEGLRALSEIGDAAGINVIVENHGGLSSNGRWLAETIKKVDHNRCGTLPDFGNFKIGRDRWYDRYQGVHELMPFAKAVSAKSHEFDDQGNETRTDYARMMKIVVEAGYSGFVGIEYEGSKHSEKDGISLTKKLLERVRKHL